jgi:CDP-diacylglycerol--serine O-phosphatidyltransferase
LFAGFYAIIAAISGFYTDAVVSDLHRRRARRPRRPRGAADEHQSEFGVQYDSLSDLVSFGVAPALVLYLWSLASLKEYGPAWGKARLGRLRSSSPPAAALRLARFNTQVGVADKR